MGEGGGGGGSDYSGFDSYILWDIFHLNVGKREPTLVDSGDDTRVFFLDCLGKMSCSQSHAFEVGNTVLVPGARTVFVVLGFHFKLSEMRAPQF